MQQTTSRAIINWQSFDVAHGETVVFSQPSASAIALNRVTGATASSIAGNINANGRIFIVNPHGVVFGPTASVNTAGLLATTAGIDDSNFMQGRYEFRTPAPDSSQVSNQGVITTTDGGRVALLGVSVKIPAPSTRMAVWWCSAADRFFSSICSAMGWYKSRARACKVSLSDRR